MTGRIKSVTGRSRAARWEDQDVEKQSKVINAVKPWSFCLEISDNAVNVHNGAEVKELKLALSDLYVVYSKVLSVWRYGGTSRESSCFYPCYMYARHSDARISSSSK